MDLHLCVVRLVFGNPPPHGDRAYVMPPTRTLPHPTPNEDKSQTKLSQTKLIHFKSFPELFTEAQRNKLILMET